MSTLILHTEDTLVRVRVKEYVDRDEGPDFWTIDVLTEDLDLNIFFDSLTAVKAFHGNLGRAIEALQATDLNEEAPQGVSPVAEV